MGILVYFYEPFSSLCKKEFGDEIIKLDGDYWEIYGNFPSMETNIDAWKKYYEISNCEILKKRIKWIIDNWNINMIESIC